MASKPVEEMTREEKLAELQSYGIDPFASSAGLKPVEEMTREEKLAELESYGIGGDPTFGESFERSALGLTQSTLGVAPQVFGQLYEDIRGKPFDPITDFGQEESYSNPLKEFGRNVVRNTEEKLSQIKKDRTTFRDVEDAYDAKGFLEALPVFGQYAKETFAEQAAPFGAFAGSYAAGNLITRGAALAAGSALGPVLGPIAGAATALGAFYLPNYAGEVAQERKEDEGEDYVLETEDTVNDLKYSLPASALAFLSDRLLLGFTPTAKLLEGGGLYSKVTVDAATGATVESLTEIGERMTQRAALGKSLDDEEAVEEYREIGIASGLFGSGTRAVSSVGEYYLEADRDEARRNLVDTVLNEGREDAVVKDAYESGQLDIPGLAPVTEEQTQRQKLVEALQKAKQKDEEIQSTSSLSAVAKAQEALDNFDIKQASRSEKQYDLFDEDLNREIERGLDPSVKLRDTLRKKAKKLEEQRKKQGKKKVPKANKMQLATPAVWKYLEETKLYGGGEEFIQLLEKGQYTGSISGSGERVTLADLKAFLAESTGIDEQAFNQTEDGSLDIDFKQSYEDSRRARTDERTDEGPEIGSYRSDTRSDEVRARDLEDLFGERYDIDADDVGADDVGADDVGADDVGADDVGADDVDTEDVDVDIDKDIPDFKLVPPKPIAYADDPNNVEPFVDRQLAAMNAGTYAEFQANLSEEDRKLSLKFADRIDQLLEQKQRQESDLEAARKDQLDLFPSEEVDEWAEYEASVMEDDIKASIEGDALTPKTLNFQLQELGITPKNVTKKLQELRKAGYNISLSGKEARTGILSNTKKEKIIEAEKNRREANQRKEDATNELRSRIDAYRTRSFANKANVPITDWIKDPYSEDFIDPRYFKSTQEDITEYKLNLDKLKQDLSKDKITQREYDQKRLELEKRLGRLPAPLKGLSTDEVIAFIREGENNKDGIGSYRGIESIAGREAGLRHLAGDIASSTITRSNLESDNAINIINEKTTNFGPKGIGTNVDATINLFFPYTGSQIGQTYYNSLTDAEKNAVIQMAREYKKALPRSVKGTSKTVAKQANNRINQLQKRLDRHKKAVASNTKAKEDFDVGRISRANYEAILQRNRKHIRQSTSYIDEGGNRVEVPYEVGAEQQIQDLKEQSQFVSDLLQNAEVQEKRLEDEIKELNNKLNNYEKGSKEHNSILQEIQAKEESLANFQTDSINQLDNASKNIYDQVETDRQRPYTQEEESFIRKYFNDPKTGFVRKVINFNENIANEINIQYLPRLRQRLDIIERNFKEGKIGEDQKNTLIRYFTYSADQISEMQGISTSTKIFEDIRKAFAELVAAKEENNIRNDIFVKILQTLTPQLIVNSPTSYAPINLMETLVEPYVESLSESEFARLDAELQRETNARSVLSRKAVKIFADVHRKKNFKPTTKDKTLSKLSELLGLSALEIENRITILESPEQSGIENMPRRAGGAVVNGRPYLFTNNIREGNEIATFMHEVGVHVGMAKLLGGNFKQLASRIRSFLAEDKWKNTAERTIAFRAYERLKYANSLIDKKSQVNLDSTANQEELVAYFVEEAVRFGINPLATKNAKNFANSETLKNWFKQFMDSAIATIKRIFNIQISTDKDSGGYKVDYVVGEDGKARTDATTRNTKGEFIKSPDTTGLNADDIVNLAYGAAKIGMVDESGLFFKVDKNNPAKSKFILKGTRFSITNNNLSLDIPSEGAIAGKNVLDTIGKSKEELLPVWDQNFADGVVGKLSQAPNWLRRGYYGLLSLPQLADTVRRVSPSLANAIEELNNASAIKRRLIEDQRGRFRDAIIKVKLLQEKESKEDITKFNRITNKSSIADADGNRYDLREYFKPNPDPNVVNSELYQQFLTLPDTLKAAYKIIVDEYENAGKVYKEALLNMMTNATSEETAKVVSELEAELADPNTLGTRRLEISDKLDEINAKILSDKEKILNQMFIQGEIKPFIPLVRRGSYWLKEEGEPDTSPSYAFETKREAEKFRKAFLKKYPNVKFVADDGGNTIFQKIGNENIIYGDSQTSGYLPQIMATIRKQLGKNPDDPANQKVESILNDVQELYLASQPRESLMQQFRKRREVPGFEDDVLQNFSHMGMKYANQIAMLQANPAINNAYGKIKNIIAPEGKAFSDQFSTVIATLQGRKSFLLDPTPVSWAAQGAYLGYAWYILGNISSAIVNLTHLALVAYPALAAEYGPVKAFGAMMDAFKFYAAGGRDNNTELTFFGYKDKGPRKALSLKDRTMFAFGDENNKISKSMTPEFLRKYGFTQQEMQELYGVSIDRSTIRRSSAQELQDIRRGSVDQFAGAYSKAELGLGWVFQNSERLLREVQTLASYKLAKEKYGKNATREQLINRTTAFVEEVNGPALTETGPEFLQDNFGKFFGVFKKFAFAMIYYQWKLLRDAWTYLGTDETGKDIQRNPNLPPDMPSVKSLAKRQFLASFVPAILFAGVRGMPYFGLITLLGDLFRDEEEDGQTDMIVRQAVGDIMYRGPFSHYLNVDFASRTGFYALAFRDDPYRRSEIGNLAFAFESLAGPVYSIARSPERALDYYNKGETEKAIETILPSFIRNPLKAVRYGTEGALNSKGYPIVDDVSTWNVALQAAGFAPNDLANQYQQNEWVTTRQRNVYDQKNSILTKYYFARLVGDSEEMQALQKEIRKFNSRKIVQEMGQAITSDTIQRSLKMRERKANEAIGGIVLPDREREAIMRDLGYD